MPDLIEVITGAVEGIESNDAPEVVDTPEVAVDAAPVEGETPAEPVDSDPLTLELDGLGIKKPKAGERENRLPYDRSRKIYENGWAKREEKIRAEFKVKEDRLAVTETKARDYDNIEKLIDSDPDRYIGMLATLKPDLYKKFISGQNLTPAEEKKVVAAVTAPTTMPAADITYSDGSKGYSVDQLQARDQWLMDQAQSKAVEQVTKEFNARLHPFEQREKALKLDAELRPVIQKQTEAMREAWGELFTQDENKGQQSEILGYMRAHPGIKLEVACAHVLVPQMRANKDTIRAGVIKELNARPAAAARVPAAPAKSEAASDEPKSLEDVIKASMDAAGLRG